MEVAMCFPGLGLKTCRVAEHAERSNSNKYLNCKKKKVYCLKKDSVKLEKNLAKFMDMH